MLRVQSNQPKFILLSKSRSGHLGQIEPDSYRIQILPILVSGLHKALATLNRTQICETAPHIRTKEEQKKFSDIRMRRKAKSVLVVEGIEINRVVKLKQLEMLGYSAVVAHNGQEGLQK